MAGNFSPIRPDDFTHFLIGTGEVINDFLKHAMHFNLFFQFLFHCKIGDAPDSFGSACDDGILGCEL